jgi:IPT/TIG domain
LGKGYCYPIGTPTGTQIVCKLNCITAGSWQPNIVKGGHSVKLADAVANKFLDVKLQITSAYIYNADGTQITSTKKSGGDLIVLNGINFPCFDVSGAPDVDYCDWTDDDDNKNQVYVSINGTNCTIVSNGKGTMTLKCPAVAANIYDSANITIYVNG